MIITEGDRRFALEVVAQWRRWSAAVSWRDDGGNVVEDLRGRAAQAPAFGLPMRVLAAVLEQVAQRATERGRTCDAAYLDVFAGRVRSGSASEIALVLRALAAEGGRRCRQCGK